MKKLGLVLVASMFAAVLVAMSTSSSHATPVFKKQFEEKYPALKSVTDEQKCNLCHYGKSKKNKNDYGKALGELLKKDNYKDERVKAEPEKVKAEFEAAFTKVEAAKSKGGETFGERIKAGKAPGTPEEGN
ncbi:MAG: hypothetical protein U1A77_21035 [Pirellulales bacterium]